jgi:hypothetical protein
MHSRVRAACMVPWPSPLFQHGLCRRGDISDRNRARTGSLIKATDTNAPLLQDTSGNTLVTCSSATLTGELTKNSEGEVQGKITSATYRGTGAQATGEPAPECTSVIGNVSLSFPRVPRSARRTAPYLDMTVYDPYGLARGPIDRDVGEWGK